MRLLVSLPSITRILAFIYYPFERVLYLGRSGITRFSFRNPSQRSHLSGIWSQAGDAKDDDLAFGMEVSIPVLEWQRGSLIPCCDGIYIETLSLNK
jgi:hypothetical protein